MKYVTLQLKIERRTLRRLVTEIAVVGIAGNQSPPLVAFNRIVQAMEADEGALELCFKEYKGVPE